MKRLICFVLAAVLAAGMLTVSAYADEQPIITGTFTYMPSFVDDPAEETFYYSDDYFAAPSSQENDHLLTMSMALAYSSMEIVGSSYVTKLLGDIGFEDIAVEDMDTVPTRDTIGTAIAHKNIGGKELVAVSIRGNKYGAEWAANLTAGASGNIEGFDDAAQKVINRIRDYIKAHGLENVKLWIAGYSRGGSVADLAGVYINNNLSEFSTTADDVFVFAFEPPFCSADPTVYDNIVCVKNKNDVITYVYPQAWGLYTNGREITIGDDKILTTYKIDVGGTELKVPLGEIAADKFLAEFAAFLADNLPRDAYSGDFDDVVTALIELYFSKPASEWEPTINYLKNDFMTDIKANNKIQYIITGELMGGITAHNSDKMYRQVIDELLLVIDEVTSAEKMNLSDDEFEILKQSVYPIFRVLGPVLVKDFLYKEGIDYSEVLPANYDDPDYDPQTADPRILTYKQLKESESDYTGETPSDASLGEEDGRSKGYHDGYQDALDGKDKRTEAPLPDDADERSDEYIEAYTAYYMESYESGYYGGIEDLNTPEWVEYDTQGSLDGDLAALADARKDAYVQHYKESYKETPDAPDGSIVPAEMLPYYIDAFVSSYKDQYDIYYDGGLEYYKELTLYHVGTFAFNIKEILSEHYPQTSWAYMTARDPYYAQAGIQGDMDGDGVVGSNDALLILRHSAELDTLTEDQRQLADMDGDGVITSNDALIALRLSAGLDGESDSFTTNAVYLGVENYGSPNVNKDTKETFRYRFLINGKETVLKIDSGEKDEDGDYNYPIQNKLKENYTFIITIKNDTVIAAQELSTGNVIDYEPVVSGTPGKKTIANFLKTAMEPVGTTLYIYGGGWDWQDVGASVQAKSIGVSSDWVRFFNEQDVNFTYRSKDYDEKNADPAHSYYPYGEYNEYYYAGLDCSGYVGWALYNTFETENGKDGYVTWACAVSDMLSERGFGERTADIAAPSVYNGYEMKPGDIMSMDGHVWISLGTCSDKSVVIAHSSPGLSRTGQPGGGVQISAVGSSKDCEAYKLADQYMSKYYPEWYERYPVMLADPGSYFEFEDEDAGRFTWNTSGGNFSDPEGVAQMTPAEVLSFLFE